MVGTGTSGKPAVDARSNGFHKVPLPPDLQREIVLSDNARTVLRKRYLRRGEDGQPVETEQEMFWRVAYHVAKAEADYGGDVEGTARRFYDLLTGLKFFPNSPTFTGAGTPLGQLAACFVLQIEDDMGRTGAGIFETLRDAALIQQTGGGNGFSFSRLRPEGAVVRSSNGKATGPVGFLRVYDKAFGEIAQGGCVVGETLVATVDGPVPIRDLIGRNPLVYSYDFQHGQRIIRRARDVRLTGRQREIYRLHLEDGFSLVATYDHPVMLSDGDYCALGDLRAGQSVMPFGDYGIVAEIEYAGRADVYDLEVPQTHNFAVVNAEDGSRGVYIHNSRRGANMAVLRVDHPDVRHFITCKTDENAITNFNISVGITDAFMTAVEQDTDFELVNPQDGKVWETVRARELFDLIVKQAHHNGEPGVLFLDAANRQNPVPHLYELESTNPCVTGDTLVATPSGWRRADEIQVGDDICTVLGTGQVDTVEVHESMPIYAVRFSDGGMIRATTAHQFYVYDAENGEFEPRRLDNLKIGDGVRVLQPVTANYPVQETPEPSYAEIVSIEPAGVATVYDLHEPRSDTWITEGYVSRGCGEQFLGPYENCCLGSINLAKHITADQRIDWDGLRESVETSTRFLEDVVTANAYVPAVPQLQEAAHRVRRIGLGIMGLADMMYALGVRYGSAVGQEFASQIIEFVRYHAMKTSIELAQARGPFPAIEGSVYDPADLKWQPPQPLVPYRHDWGRPALDWAAIVDGIRQHGIRNGAQLTVAPTGTISTVAGCEGYGCEPVFALAYTRYVNDAGKQISLQYTSPLFERALRGAGLDDEAIQRIIDQVNISGTCQDADGLPDAIRRVFVVSADVTAEEHVRMQAVLQTFTDNAISKTVNFPAGATEDDVATAYKLGWKLGCKGLTVYVTGSREKVVLETAETRQKKQPDSAAPVEQPRLFNEDKKPRPRRLSGKTYRVQTPLGTTYVTVNENGEGKGQPFEVFLHNAKAGSETAAVSEAMGRLISYTLRLASTVSPRIRLTEIVRQFSGIGGVRSIGFGPSRVSSLPDGLAQVLQEYLDESELDLNAAVEPGEPVAEVTVSEKQLTLPIDEARRRLGDLCPECGAATLVAEEGCRKCYSCGFSEC
jgi:ribonucleotide reductase alpha subunit